MKTLKQRLIEQARVQAHKLKLLAYDSTLSDADQRLLLRAADEIIRDAAREINACDCGSPLHVADIAQYYFNLFIASHASVTAHLRGENFITVSYKMIDGQNEQFEYETGKFDEAAVCNIISEASFNKNFASADISVDHFIIRSFEHSDHYWYSLSKQFDVKKIKLLSEARDQLRARLFLFDAAHKRPNHFDLSVLDKD